MHAATMSRFRLSLGDARALEPVLSARPSFLIPPARIVGR